MHRTVKWQRRAPEIGWYWMRQTSYPIGDRSKPYVTYPEIVEVLFVENRGRRRYATIDTHDSEGGRRDVRLWPNEGDEWADRHAEWAGPLPMPEADSTREVRP